MNASERMKDKRTEDIYVIEKWKDDNISFTSWLGETGMNDYIRVISWINETRMNDYISFISVFPSACPAPSCALNVNSRQQFSVCISPQRPTSCKFLEYLILHIHWLLCYREESSFNIAVVSDKPAAETGIHRSQCRPKVERNARKWYFVISQW